ncbi:GerAB/ArcD/ProY family transporter [Paenactinomyces guangxiensis]|uniref:GerAB/ArcD/ProY family transporter n=1 Tax=Paenactinomyces guangxiensis TaxID=1490290 RepID=A0A7W1WRK2_9BACL|nr:GerAB/ArcD/ProY family transporter [Paenactinomyces guangxiensis]MBA4494770.1 GerAB/ArcD/ProY family transporter [Paenactinomyces guangxiensis]MBH8591854.1 GerAB/ArcD/ProY family transporter [Paenactinomyces guangxiensis]
MEKTSISANQLFCLVILFELGSSVIVGLGSQAKQDAWLSVLLALVGGVLLFLVFSSLYRQFPGEPLTSYIRSILGKWIGWPLGLVYVLYFMYISARVLNDMSALIQIAWLNRTPMVVLGGMLILSISYVVYHGINVLAKTGEFFLPIYLLSLVISFLLIIFSGLLQMENIQPVGEDWELIIKTAYPLVYTFPFGEMIVFTMLLPYLKKQKKSIKTGLLAIVISGLILSLVIAQNIATVGAHIAGRAPFPFLVAIAKVNIGEFLQRIDVISVFILVVGAFFKVGIFFYAAVMGATDLFRIRKRKQMVYPIGIIILFLSLTISANFVEHIREGLTYVPIYLHIPLQTVVPVLLLLISLLKNRRTKGPSVNSC